MRPVHLTRIRNKVGNTEVTIGHDLEASLERAITPERVCILSQAYRYDVDKQIRDTKGLHAQQPTTP